eukprot:COSAG01_NODE_27889_length_674_cov_1.139130_2_plen_107_part_01
MTTPWAGIVQLHPSSASGQISPSDSSSPRRSQWRGAREGGVAGAHVILLGWCSIWVALGCCVAVGCTARWVPNAGRYVWGVHYSIVRWAPPSIAGVFGAQHCRPRRG